MYGDESGIGKMYDAVIKHTGNLIPEYIYCQYYQEESMKFDLIKELNADHSALVEMLKRIGAKGIIDDDTVKQLQEFRAALIAHLQKEDREFYPVMNKDAETNPALAETLKVMGMEMEQLADKALKMIDGWLAGLGSTSFAADFQIFCSLLAARIKKEENSLYSRYLKLA